MIDRVAVAVPREKKKREKLLAEKPWKIFSKSLSTIMLCILRTALNINTNLIFPHPF